MTLEKILVNLKKKQFSFTVEVFPDEDGTIYRVTPDEAEGLPSCFSGEYIDFDEKGNRQYQPGEQIQDSEAKEVNKVIWQSIQQQILDINKPAD